MKRIFLLMAILLLTACHHKTDNERTYDDSNHKKKNTPKNLPTPTYNNEDIEVSNSLFFKSHALLQKTEKNITFSEILVLFKKNYPQTNINLLKEWVYSFTYGDKLELLISNLKSSLDFPSRNSFYEDKTTAQNPFDGYLAAKTYLEDKKLEDLTTDDIHILHKKLLSHESVAIEHKGDDKSKWKNSEEIEDEDLGIFREVDDCYNATNIDNDIQTLNGILSKMSEDIISDGLGREEFAKRSPFLSLFGKKRIAYANLSMYTKQGVKELLSDDVYKQIDELGKKDKKYLELNCKDNSDVYEYRKNIYPLFIKSLIEKKLIQLKKDLKNTMTYPELLSVVAKFQHDFLAIHPYSNGNGRTSTLLVEKILNSYGLPSPIWIAINENTELTHQQLEVLLDQSIHVGDLFIKELKDKISKKKDLRTVSAPYFLDDSFNKNFLDTILKKYSNKLIHEHVKNNITKIFIPEQFMLWIYSRDFSAHFSQQDIENQSLENLVVMYLNWIGKFTFSIDANEAHIMAIPPKHFIKGLSSYSKNKDKHSVKMESYLNNKLIYRGAAWFSDDHDTISDDDILKTFVRYDAPLTGEGFILGNGIDVLKAKTTAQKYWDQLIQDMVTPQGNKENPTYASWLKDRLDHHIKENDEDEKYSNSTLMSTSTDFKRAESFTFYTSKKNGNHHAIISMMTPKYGSFDVYSPILHNELGDFYYKNEKEFSVAFAIDPESIQSIRFVDSDIEKSFILAERDKSNYNKVTICRFNKNNQNNMFSNENTTCSQADSKKTFIYNPIDCEWNLY